jgi:hypothetical protein
MVQSLLCLYSSIAIVLWYPNGLPFVSLMRVKNLFMTYRQWRTRVDIVHYGLYSMSAISWNDMRWPPKQINHRSFWR